MQLQKALALFMRENRADDTNKLYGCVLNQLIQWLGPRRPIEKLSVLDLKEWHLDLQTRDYKSGTVTIYVKITKVFFNWCVNQEMLVASPARTLKAGKVSRRSADSKAATKEEVERFLTWSQHDPRLYAVMLFLIQSGARAGEAASLRIDAIDFDRHTATVVCKGGKARHGQAEERREVVFGKATAAAIKAWLKRRDHDGVIVNQQVFAKTSRPIDGSAITHYVRSRTPRILDRRVTAHQFRHYFGEMLALEGVATSLISRLMGHKNEMVTLTVYAPRDMNNARRIALPLLDTKLPEQHKPVMVEEQERGDTQSSKIIKFPFPKIG